MRFNIFNFLQQHPTPLPVSLGVLTLLMFILTLIPSEVLGPNPIWSYDKLGHLVLFGSWTYLLGLYYAVKINVSVNPLGIFFIGFFFGGLIELLQYLLPLNRQADFMDLLFDGLGCLIGIWLLKMTLPK